MYPLYAVFKTLFLYIFLSFFLPSSLLSQISVNQIDDFSDGTTQNWQQGQVDPTFLSNQSGTLQISSDGSTSFGRLIAYNQTQWAGDYISQGITAIKMKINNTGTTTLRLRLAFGDATAPNNSNSTWFSSSTPVSVTPGLGELEVVFFIKEADLTRVQGTASYTSVLSNVTTLRIVNGTVPTSKGDFVTATLQVDDIRACLPNIATSFEEMVNGDLSDDRLQPTVLTVSEGGNVVAGCVQGDPRDIDYFTFEVPTGKVLDALQLTDYIAAPGNLAFMGIQSGTTFTEPTSGTE